MAGEENGTGTIRQLIQTVNDSLVREIEALRHEIKGVRGAQKEISTSLEHLSTKMGQRMDELEERQDNHDKEDMRQFSLLHEGLIPREQRETLTRLTMAQASTAATRQVVKGRLWGDVFGFPMVILGGFLLVVLQHFWR